MYLILNIGGTLNMDQPIFRSLVCPWVRARVKLGLVAQWKGFYLFNNYDKVLSVLKKLCFLAGITTNYYLDDYDGPPLRDGTTANGNWSIKAGHTDYAGEGIEVR